VLENYQGSVPLVIMPNWRPANLASAPKSEIGGGLSWLAWPTDGNNGPARLNLTTNFDQAYMSALEERPYIARERPFCVYPPLLTADCSWILFFISRRAMVLHAFANLD
jgi:hypothetical protein